MSLDWVLGWWNLIYVIPFGMALLYLTAYVASGWTFGDVDLDANINADVDVDVDVEADLDLDGEGELGLAHEHGLHTPGRDIDADTDVSGSGAIMTVLSWAGVGRAPLSILLMVLFLCFGAAGFCANEVFRGLVDPPWLVLVSLPIAGSVGFALTAMLARAMARWMPMSETSARPKRALVGCRATTVFAVDADRGVAAVRAADGDRYQVACRMMPGREPVAAETEVVLVRYDLDRDLFLIVPSRLSEASPAAVAGDAIRV